MSVHAREGFSSEGFSASVGDHEGDLSIIQREREKISPPAYFPHGLNINAVGNGLGLGKCFYSQILHSSVGAGAGPTYMSDFLFGWLDPMDPSEHRSFSLSSVWVISEACHPSCEPGWQRLARVHILVFLCV